MRIANFYYKIFLIFPVFQLLNQQTIASSSISDVLNDASSRGIMTTTRLPQEIWENIFNYLHDNYEGSRTPVSHVSKLWKKAKSTSLSYRNNPARDSYIQYWTISEETKKRSGIEISNQYMVPEELQNHSWHWDASWKDFESYYKAPSIKEEKHKLPLSTLISLSITRETFNFFKDQELLTTILGQTYNLRTLVFKRVLLPDEFVVFLTKFLEKKDIKLKTLFFTDCPASYRKLEGVIKNCAEQHCPITFEIEGVAEDEALKLSEIPENYQKTRVLFSSAMSRQLGKRYEDGNNVPRALFYYNVSSDKGNTYSSLDFIRLLLRERQIQNTIEAFNVLREVALQKSFPKVFRVSERIPEIRDFLIDLIQEFIVQEKSVEKNSEEIKKINETKEDNLSNEQKKQKLEQLEREIKQLEKHLFKLKELLIWPLFKVNKLFPQEDNRNKFLRVLHVMDFIPQPTVEALKGKVKPLYEELETKGNISAIILKSKIISLPERGYEEAIKYLEGTGKGTNKRAYERNPMLIKGWLGFYKYKIWKRTQSDEDLRKSALLLLRDAARRGHINSMILASNLVASDLHAGKSEIEEIFAFFKRGVEADNSYAKYCLGNALISGKLKTHSVEENVEEGKRLLREAADQGNSWALDLVVKALMEEKKYDEAIVYLKIGAENASSLDRLGWIYSTIKHDYSKAEEYFKKAYELDPTNYSVWRNWGWLRLLQCNSITKLKSDNWRDKSEDNRKTLLKDAEKFTLQALELAPANKKFGIENNLKGIREVRKEISTKKSAAKASSSGYFPKGN